jgi:multidrug resistance efflux pump
MEQTMETMKAHVGKMEAQLNRWGAKLDALAAKTESSDAGAKNKADFKKHIDDLKAKHKLVKSKLEESRIGGIDKWMTFKAGLERSWKTFEKAFKKFSVRLKAELII